MIAFAMESMMCEIGYMLYICCSRASAAAVCSGRGWETRRPGLVAAALTQFAAGVAYHFRLHTSKMTFSTEVNLSVLSHWTIGGC